MRENRVRTNWQQGGTVMNGWLGIASSYVAEIMAHEAFDSVAVDLQHGMVDFQSAVGMLQAIATKPEVTPLARVPWNDPAIIMKLLDAGAYGIICPMINNREQAERFAGAMRYAPQGYRSFGPPRGLLYGGPDYAAKSNETVIAFAMIETAEAMGNLDAIMSTPGIDAIYVGPNDLSISLGYPPSAEPKEPEVVEAMHAICAAAKRNGVAPGIHCASGDMARRMSAAGFRFCTIANDARLLSAEAKNQLAIARG